MTFRTWLLTIPVLSSIFWSGCNRNSHNVMDASAGVKPIGAPVEINVPLGLPPVPIPPGAPETVETIALGRKLFYEENCQWTTRWPALLATILFLDLPTGNGIR